MNLLLTRSQAAAPLISFLPLRIGRSVTFKLNAEFELDSEEHALMNKYGFQKASLIYSDTFEDLKRAFSPAWYLGLMAFFFSLFALQKVRIGGFEGIFVKIAIPPSSALITVAIMTTIYFFALRKNVTVDQLLNGGRTFFCHSVVELDEQEQELKDLARRFHATLEKAKNWGGRELNPIPDGEILYLSDADYNSKKKTFESTMHMAGRAVGGVMNTAYRTGEVIGESIVNRKSEAPAEEKKTERFEFKPDPMKPSEPGNAGTTGGPSASTVRQNQSVSGSQGSDSSNSPQTHSTKPSQQTSSVGSTYSSPNMSAPHPLAPKPPDRGNNSGEG